MPSINLDSFSTFWSSAKSFFNSDASTYKTTVLYDGEGSFTKNPVLSESIDNFERIEVTWATDSNSLVVSEFVPALTGNYFSAWNFEIGSNRISNFDIFTWSIDTTTRDSFTKEAEIKVTFTPDSSSSSITRTVTTVLKGITKVVGINRIANN